MTKNGSPFRETAVTLRASLPAPMQIRLRQDLQMSPPQVLTEPKFRLSRLWQHNSPRSRWLMDRKAAASDGAQPLPPSVSPLRPMA